jgi:hypothetical protein
MTSCIDVGIGYPGGDAPGTSLIAEWSGHAWTVNTPDELSDAYSNVVWGPSSCTTALGCLILGHNAPYVSPAVPDQSATLWTGTQWTAFPPLTTATSYPLAPVSFDGLSCVAQTCFAVGYTNANPIRTVVERYS